MFKHDQLQGGQGAEHLMEILTIVLEELNILLSLEREILAMFFLKEKKGYLAVRWKAMNLRKVKNE